MDLTVPFLDSKILDTLKELQMREKIESYVKTKNLLHARDETKNSLLHFAVWWEDTVLAKYLIDSGCEIDAKNAFEETPLTEAIKYRKVIVEYLLKVGAKIDVSTICGKSTVRMIGERVYWSTKELRLFLQSFQADFLDNKENIGKLLFEEHWPFCHIIRLRDAELTKIWLECCNKTEINVSEIISEELHDAVKCADFENVKLLLSYNADVNIQDSVNRTALSYVYNDKNDCINIKRFDILKILLDRGTVLGNQGYDIYRYATKEAINLLLNLNVGISSPYYKLMILLALVNNENPGVIDELQGRNFFNVNSLSIKSGFLYIVIKINKNVTKAEFLMNEIIKDLFANQNDPAEIIVPQLLATKPRFTEERYKPCLQFFLEHGMNVQLKVNRSHVIDSEIRASILDAVLERNFFVLGKLVLSHLALQEMQGISINELSRKQIESNDRFKIFFESSKERLKMKIYNSISLFDLSTISDKKFELYVRNEELLSSIQDTITALSEYDYFHILLQKRLKPAVIIVTLRNKAAPIICKIMRTRYDTFPLIADIIMNYLSQKDMENLIEALL